MKEQKPNLENIQLRVSRFKRNYNKVSFVSTHEERTCANCGTKTTDFIDIKLKIAEQKEDSNILYSLDSYCPHLAYVCSKPCETMFILKIM